MPPAEVIGRCGARVPHGHKPLAGGDDGGHVAWGRTFNAAQELGHLLGREGRFGLDRGARRAAMCEPMKPAPPVTRIDGPLTYVSLPGS